MVGPDARVNSAGVKGGEGQETRLFPLTWVRYPSGNLLPSCLFTNSRRKGGRTCPSPFLFARSDCTAIVIPPRPLISGKSGSSPRTDVLPACTDHGRNYTAHLFPQLRVAFGASAPWWAAADRSSAASSVLRLHSPAKQSAWHFTIPAASSGASLHCSRPQGNHRVPDPFHESVAAQRLQTA